MSSPILRTTCLLILPKASAFPAIGRNTLTSNAPQRGRTKTPDHGEQAERLNQKLAALQQESGGRAPTGVHPRPKNTLARVPSNLSRGFGPHLAYNSQFPATPDPTESDLQSGVLDRARSSFFDQAYTPLSGASQSSLATASVEQDAHAETEDTFANAVATPPIVDSDLEVVDEPNTDRSVSMPRPLHESLATQNASLPSPGLSPTYTGTDLEDGMFFEADEDEQSTSSLADRLQDSSDEEIALQISKTRRQIPANTFQSPQVPNLRDTSNMLAMFDSMPNELQSFMMYQFLRRCSRKTLHIVADVVNPALKCDFLDQLPLELTLHILSFLDHKDQCRAAQVSKRWRLIIDTNETGWKELFDRDGFTLPHGELERAVEQGWGWQDPFGPDAHERDLSVSRRPNSSDGTAKTSISRKLEIDSHRRLRSTKRKRGQATGSSERAKRMLSEHEFSDKARQLVGNYQGAAKYHKSEGPFTAASAAAAAVPDPGLGLPSLRTMHLYKSLYRRHRLLQESWMNNKIAPHHFAFSAHPNHVITCLQFDDDKIITGSDDTLIHVYDTKTGRLRKKLEGHEGGVWALQYEGNVLVSGSTDRSVRVWDIEKGICTQVFHGHTSTVRCLQILMPELVGYNDKGAVMLPEKPLIITGSRDSQLRVWRLPEQGSKRFIQSGPPANDAECPYFVRVLSGHSHSVRAIAAHQDTLVSGSYDNSVRVWKISTGETIHRLHGHSMKVYSVVLDHKRNRCISGSMDNFVRIWSLDTGACLFTLEGHSSLVGLLDLKDERLVSAAADSTLRIWDPENGQCKSTLSAHTGAITCFQHDGHKVISGSDRTLKMWNVKTGECMKDLLTDLTGVWQVKFDERRCVAAVQRDNLTFVEVCINIDCRPIPTLILRRSLISAHHVMAFLQANVVHASCFDLTIRGPLSSNKIMNLTMNYERCVQPLIQVIIMIVDFN